MKNKGFYLSLEALFSLTLLILLILALPPTKATGFQDIYVAQKSHDLLKLWNHEIKSFNAFTVSAMLKDFKEVFPEAEGEIKINGGEQSASTDPTSTRTRVYATKGFLYIDGELQEILIEIHY